MKYPCNVIQDLLPLYIDDVCSEESKKAIEEHLSECSSCKKFYDTMRETEKVEMDAPDADHERKKAASFKAVKKKMLRKQIFAAVVAVVVLAVVTVITVGVLKSATQIVKYDDNISVSMVDGDLVSRLRGSNQTQVSIKRIATVSDGQEEEYLFFCLSDTKWNDLTTSSKVYSEDILCYADKGADQIDAVYYFTGDYTDIESMSRKELQKVIDESNMLWNK